MATKTIADIAPECQNLFHKFLAGLPELGIHVIIVAVLRTPEEEAQKVAMHQSATMNSKHLPQASSGKSHAIDVAIVGEVRGEKVTTVDWDDSTHPLYRKMGEWGESLGLRWGGRWTSPHDPYHFEFVNALFAEKPKTEAA